ncbi:enoyl-CoA hydratase/isomerase family protein [Variovorax guangxiensis]|uniref:enoyl-CoA hydratase/isomerase family protein n=1 Tax=Variovorax guangxiensis TaxID=1775474 RepID=UPI002865A179|nr:enoyl-CoA hydratase/isomerase family protein [Variovorax guangxiensis]MDR6858789.1 enoyl-CoA hydratase/carnithine racemase [Variovorax guangxiensis]
MHSIAATEAPAGPPSIIVSQEGAIATIELNRPPHNFFDLGVIEAIADALDMLEAEPRCRVVVLAAGGKSFCAGADFNSRPDSDRLRHPKKPLPLYLEGVRIMRFRKPIVAAIHGACVGGGLGVAMCADFRVASTEAKFSANFNRIGVHPGFGLSFTLPRLLGPQHAARLFYTGQRISAEEAQRIGLVDVLVAPEQCRAEALALAKEIATSSPWAVQSTRATLRKGFIEQFSQAVARESEVQAHQMRSPDFKEGVAAMTERRLPHFSDHATETPLA